jgi:hypothetical protein
MASNLTSIIFKKCPHCAFISSTCFVVLGTYEPTTIRPPFCLPKIPSSLGVIASFGFIPIRAETKLAAVRHKNRFPFISACYSFTSCLTVNVKIPAQRKIPIYCQELKSMVDLFAKLHC